MGQPLSLQEMDWNEGLEQERDWNEGLEQENEGPELEGRAGGHYLEPVARQQRVLLALAQEAAERKFLFTFLHTYVYTDFA